MLGTSVNPRDALAATALAAISALALGVLLATASSPKDFNVRTAALTATSKSIADTLRSNSNGAPPARGIVCRREPELEATSLRDQLSVLAAQAGLKLDTIDARPEGAADSGLGLSPLRVRFTVTGSYENVVTLLNALTAVKPGVFVDTLDLSAKTSNIAVNFSGRVFCSA